MSEAANFYQQALGESSTIPWFAALKKKGLHELQRLQFPTRFHEEWKYTRLDSLFAQEFSYSEAGKPSTPISSDLCYPAQIHINNGQVFVDTNALPSGVMVKSLRDALKDDEHLIKTYLNHALTHEHGFQALNTAMLRCGVVIYLSAGVSVEQPIVVSYWQDQEKQVVHSRCLIIGETDSKATVIEEYRGSECSYFTNTITEVILAKGAKLSHYKMQVEGQSAYHIGHLAARLGEASQLTSHVLSIGGHLVRSDLHFSLEEKESACFLNGIYMPTQNQHMDHHTTVYHQVPNCTSEQDYKGILQGHSRAVFNGKVIVAKDAQHSSAKQQNKNLLLSTQAEIDTKPQLEIFANDVVCTHGATVGQLDEDALFYLATRGLDLMTAKRLLIQAFVAENVRFMADPVLLPWINNLLNQQLRSSP